VDECVRLSARQKRADPLKNLSGESAFLKMFYVYVLRSLKDGKKYIGYSSDLKKRLAEHNNGKVKITKNRLPFELEYYEAYKTEIQARRQELFYKTGQGRRILKERLIK